MGPRCLRRKLVHLRQHFGDELCFGALIAYASPCDNACAASRQHLQRESVSSLWTRWKAGDARNAAGAAAPREPICCTHLEALLLT
jgi:hypothetical protein